MLALRLLGNPQILVHDEWIDIRSAKTQALLFYLAIDRHTYTRSMLAGLLWPEKPETDARTSLRQAVYQLHQLIPGSLSTTRDNLKLSERYPLTVDASRFIEQAELGLAARHAQDGAESLRLAATLYQGEFLAGFYVDDAVPYEEWMLNWRERLQRLAFQVLQRLTGLALAQQNVYEGLHFAQRLLALEPWHEETHFQLMQLLALSGQIQAALAQFESCRHLLHEELGVQPSSALVKLAKELRRGAKIRQILPPPTAVQPADSQPASLAPTSAGDATPRHNLGAPLLSFVGRRRNLADLTQILLQPDTRLVSLIGPGGVGKTRLANRLGWLALPHFRDGVWLIDLLTVSDPMLIEQAVTSIFGSPTRTHQTPLERLCGFLADKQQLLIFDNCEHLIDTAARLTADLLAAAPELKIVATSREPLRIAGELCIAITPLTLPPLQLHYAARQVMAFESVQLFVERALAHNHNFALGDENAEAVVRICRLLDGIPLAIELMAARTRFLGVQQIADQLAWAPDAHMHLAGQGRRDAHPRHQTLHNLIAWSYLLLHPDERLLLERLAIFPVSCSLAATEAICGDEMPDSAGENSYHTTSLGGRSPARHLARAAILATLAALVDKSLLIAEPAGNGMRYRLLETIRHFALSRLVVAGEEEQLRDRHLRYFIDWMEAKRVPPPGMPRALWQAQIAADLDNLRGGLTWSLRRGAAAEGLRLALACSEFWFSQGLHHESIHWFETLLSLPAAGQEKKLRLAALSNMEFTQWWVLGNYVQAHALLQEALGLAQELGEQELIEKTLNNMGGVALYAGDYAAARRYLQQCLASTAQSGNLLNRAWTSILLGEVLLQQCTAEAEVHFTEATHLLRSQQRLSLLAYPVRRLGQIAFLRQELPAALAHYEESLALNVVAGEVEGKAACVAAYAALLWRLGNEEEAALLCAAVKSSLAMSQSQLPIYDRQTFEELSAALQIRLAEPLLHSAWAAGLALSLTEAVVRIQQQKAGFPSSVSQGQRRR